MSKDAWVDRQGDRWHVTLHDPVSLAFTSDRRLAVRWTLTLAAADGRYKALYVELGEIRSELLRLGTPRRQSEFRECLFGAAKQALFMGRLGDAETVDFDGSPDNVLRLYFMPRSGPVSELATARFGFEQDERYEAEIASYVRAAIYKTLIPKQISGVVYPDLLEAVGIEEDMFKLVLDDMIENGLVGRKQPDGAAPELFRLTAAGTLDASATTKQLPRAPISSRIRDVRPGADVRPSLDILIRKLKQDDEHLDVEAKEAFFANTKHKDAKPGSPKPNDENALRGMLKALVAFANTFGGDFVVGLQDRTWEPHGIDDTDLVLCGNWDEFKRRFTRLVNEETKGIAPAPEISRAVDKDRTFAIVNVRQLPESCFRNRTLAYIRQGGRCYIRTNGDSVRLELSDIATHCDAILADGRQGTKNERSADAGSPTEAPFTKYEAELLAAAAQDGKLDLFKAANAPSWVRAGKLNFVDKTDLAVAAQYVDALESLVSKGCARHEGGVSYALTGSGFTAARAAVEREENSRRVSGGGPPSLDASAVGSNDVTDKGTTSLRGRDYRGPVSATRFQLPKQAGPPPVALDVVGDGRGATVRVYFHQTAWAVKIESHGSATEFELPIRPDAHECVYQDGNTTWVELAAAYLTSEAKPILVVKTQVDAAHGDRTCIYDVLLTARGLHAELLLDADVGYGGGPVILQPNRIEVRHCCHPESKVAGYTWVSGRFVADPADTLGEW